MKAVVLLTILIAFVACDESARSAADAARDSSVVARITREAESGEVHIIRLVANGGVYEFEPTSVSVETGDIVRFVHTSHQPESIAFLTDPVDSTAAEFLRQSGAVDAVLLTRPGQVYDMSFEGAPAGRYIFTSTTHPEMQGAVTVQD